MKKVVIGSLKHVLHNGVFLRHLRYVEGDFWRYEGLPDKAVLVARVGSKFFDLYLDWDKDLGWATFHPADIPDDWEGTYEELAREYDLPVVDDFYLDDEVVLMDTARTGRRILVVSETAWETRWEEVKSFLLEKGLATTKGTDLGEISITLGGDPEFEVYSDGELVPAGDISIFRNGGLCGAVGVDGAPCTAELRPSPACSPEEYVENFLTLVDRVSKRGILLSVQGDRYALGGHIHVGSSRRDVVRLLKDEVRKFVEVLDDFIGRVLLPTSGRARGGYAYLGAYETKDYGWEYRTPPSSFYADPEMVRIVYKLTKGLMETLLKEGEISYETLEGGKAKKEEYYRFLTHEEAEYFLTFPQRWARGDVVPFVLTGEVPPVLFSFRDEWDDDKKRVFKKALKKLPVSKPVKLVLYGLAERRGEYFALPTAPVDWVLREEFPKEPFIAGALPEIWVGIPYRFRRLEEIPEDLLEEFVRWVEEYLVQLGLLAAVSAAE